MPDWKALLQQRLTSVEIDPARSAGIVNTVDLGYFKTMAIPLLSGRPFTDTDLNGTPPVYEYLALGEKPQPCIYLPLQQNFASGMTLYVRSKSDPASIISEVARELRTGDPNVQVTDIRTGTKIINQVLFVPRIAVALLGVFGSLALALASIGLFGLRMALGANRGSVLRLVLREGMTVVCAGVAVGLAASLLVGRLLAGMLFGIGSADPLSLTAAAACLALALVALLACYFPALAATRIDPMQTLRDS